MAIFRRDDEPETEGRRPQRRNPAPPSGATTLIASGTRVVGEVTGSAKLQIEGRIEGRVQVDGQVEVGPDGFVEGEIEAREVRVTGKVHGNVRGLESVTLDGQGSVEGDVVSPRMSIAAGAFFKGKVEMSGAEKGAPTPSQPRLAGTSPPAEPPSPGGSGGERS